MRGIVLGLVLLALGCGRPNAQDPGAQNAAPDATAVIGALLAAAPQPLDAWPDCDVQFDDPNAAPVRTLGQDIARHMADLTGGINQIATRCGPAQATGQECDVTFGHDAGELVWSRVYRFRTLADGTLASLVCFTIP